jgi:hypothetical protein
VPGQCAFSRRQRNEALTATAGAKAALGASGSAFENGSIWPPIFRRVLKPPQVGTKRIKHPAAKAFLAGIICSSTNFGINTQTVLKHTSVEAGAERKE